MNLKFLIICLHLINACWGEKTESRSEKSETEEEEKFNFIRTEPANELGISSKIIAQVHRKANQTTEEWRLNRAYLPNDVYESLMSRCETDPEDRHIKWRGCVSDEEGLFAYVTWGVPEPKNKTITYLELEFKPFSKLDEAGGEQICVLEEVYKTKAYVVLNTFSEVPSNDTFPRGIVDSVAAVHQHQLDSFGENFLSIFEDKVDVDYVYNFGEDEYYDRDPPYECFLSIASSESKSVIEKKCDFFCTEDASRLSPQELEKILDQARKMADEEELEEEDIESDNDHDQLVKKRHEEL